MHYTTSILSVRVSTLPVPVCEYECTLHFVCVKVVLILQVMDVRSLSHDGDSDEEEEEEEAEEEGEGEGMEVVVSEKETALLMANAVT